MISYNLDFKLDKLEKKFSKFGFSAQHLINVEFMFRSANIVLNKLRECFKDTILRAGGLSNHEDLERVMQSFSFHIDKKNIIFILNVPEDLIKYTDRDPDKSDSEKKELPEVASKNVNQELKEGEKKRVEKRHLRDRITRANIRINELRRLVTYTRQYFKNRNKRIKDKKDKIDINAVVAEVIKNFNKRKPKELKNNDPAILERGHIIMVEEEVEHGDPKDKSKVTKVKKKISLKKTPIVTKSKKTWVHPSIARMTFVSEAFKKADPLLRNLMLEKEKLLLSKGF